MGLHEEIGLRRPLCAVDPSGKTIEVRYNAIEVLGRERDRAWKLIVGDPNDRA
jgi:hypothetical protein